MYSVAFSPDDKTLASASDDEAVCLWNVDPGVTIGAPLVGHNITVKSVAFSPDRKTLASSSKDTTARLWDVETRENTVSRQMGIHWLPHLMTKQCACGMSGPESLLVLFLGTIVIVCSRSHSRRTGGNWHRDPKTIQCAYGILKRGQVSESLLKATPELSGQSCFRLMASLLLLIYTDWGAYRVVTLEELWNGFQSPRQY